MPDDLAQEMIRQLTLRKLAFARELLREHGLAVSGTREALTERLAGAVDKGAIELDDIHHLLDELDAPLDESNIGRFTDLLKKFVHESQFIIITHNKSTVAAADALYGVTMQEQGVSKRVAWAEPLGLDEVKSVSRALRCTVNDLLLASASGALRSYMLERGENLDGVTIRATVPVKVVDPDAVMLAGGPTTTQGTAPDGTAPSATGFATTNRTFAVASGFEWDAPRMALLAQRAMSPDQVKTLLGAMDLSLEPAGSGQLEEDSPSPVSRTRSVSTHE